MTKERADRLGKYLPEHSAPFERDGMMGVLRMAYGQGPEGSYVLTEEHVQTDDGQLVRHRVSLHYPDGYVTSAVLEDGEIAGIEGFGEGLGEEDMAYHARDLFHGFARSEKSETDPRM